MKNTLVNQICAMALALLISGAVQAEATHNPLRISSPWPAQNAIITMLGYGDNIVGTSLVAKNIPLFRQILPAIDKVPSVSVSGSHELNPEQIIALRTQLLFVPQNMDIPQRDMLLRAGVKILAFKANSMQAMVERVMATAHMLGPDAERKALRYRHYFQRNVELVGQRLASLPPARRIRVYHSMGSPMITSGRPSLNQDWMDLAGAQNVAENWFDNKKNSGGEAPIERIVASNPDVIITMNSRDAELMRHSAQWQGVNAVKNHRVYVNPKGIFWWSRETSEEALQFVWLAKTLYPQRLRDVDMEQETHRFYRDFFGVSFSKAQIKHILNPEVG